MAERAVVEESDTAFCAKAVVPLACSVVPESEVQGVRSQLPDGFSAIFELTDAEATPW